MSRNTPRHRFQLMVAPNGARRMRADHPNLPMTNVEIAATARACFDAGAGAIHLHVRDAKGRHSLDAGRYREAMAAVHETTPDMQIQITTESAGVYDVAAQMACLAALRPKAASVSVREMARDPGLAAQIYALAAEVGTDVQHILYGPACVAQFQRWQVEGVIDAGAQNVICVLGSYAPARAALTAELAAFQTVMLPDQWWVCAFGASEHQVLHAALGRGANLRIGFENSIDDGLGTHASNAASITKFLKLLQDSDPQLDAKE